MTKERWSASKIELFEECDWAFYCKYRLKIPDVSNDGQRRGNVCHTIFECLLNKKDRRRKYFDKIIKNNNVEACKPVWRLLIKSFKREGLKSELDIDLINQMVLTGLKNDFYCKGATSVLPEKEFKFEEEHFSMIGYIDKLAIYPNDITVFDYKTGKSKFTDEKLANNYQAYTYSLAVYKEYSIIPNVKFIFVKFPRSPILPSPQLNKDSLSSYINYVNYVAAEASKIEEGNANQRMAAYEPKRRWKCGKANSAEEEKRGVWCCPYKFAKRYYSAIDKDGKILYSSYEPIIDTKIVELGGKIVEKEYAGCPAYQGLQNVDPVF